MRKPDKIIALVCALVFTNTIALNLPFSTNQFDTPTSTNLTLNLTNLEYQLPPTPAKVVNANKCYSSNVPVPRISRVACNHAIWQLPQDPTPRTFEPSAFPIRKRYDDCIVTLALHEMEIGSWYSVDRSATNLWFACQREYPETLRGATGAAGFHGYIFVRIWYEKQGNVTDEGLTAREISEEGMERDEESGGLSDQG